ncbi:SCO6745 family protein [Pseudonocardia sp. GCM10023141]|uniref:SCO6745 family protein n=1 Tax=Pseudonocardia sp. GCM10023141 TaxID=3252653 RepID=UPI003610AF1D
MDPRDSGRIARRMDALHGITYFVPETEEHLVGVGLVPGRMTYFAGRSAAMGAVGAGVVTATFYNFNPALVATHIPAAWTLASPATVVTARYASVDAALRRLLGAEALAAPEVVEAAGLARIAAEACTPQGRPLAAAHLDLDWPTDPHMVLWHAVTILREHRGDAHVTLLLGAELDGLEALISHAAVGRGFLVEFAQQSRGWRPEVWATGVARLQERGILDADGAITEDGRALRARIEHDTDRLGNGPWTALGAERAARLAEILQGIAAALFAAGAYPEGLFAKAR